MTDLKMTDEKLVTYQQLIQLSEFETDLMVLNARVQCLDDIWDVDDDSVCRMIDDYKQLAERYALYKNDQNIKSHTICDSIDLLRKKTAFNHFWLEGVDNALDIIEIRRCPECRENLVCGIHG